MSVVKDRQVELAEAREVGEDVDFDDRPAPGEDLRLPTEGRDGVAPDQDGVR